MIFAYFKAIVSEYKVEMVLGEISPKTRITSVRMPVPILIALFPQILMTNVVDMEEAVKLTTLFPTRIALSIFPWFSSIFVSVMAFLLPASASVLTLIRFTVVNAVSADEKNADNETNKINVSNCI
jgi:hypothetical protein